MIAKQAVYLNADRSKAVPEGHPDAKFLLVREGHEIEDSLVEKHGAEDLVGASSRVKAKEAPAIEPPTLKGDQESPAPARPAKKQAAKKSAKK